MNENNREPPIPRWLHWWAVGTVCATFVLLALGSIVTTFRVGMTDPIWPTYPWHLLLISWEEPSRGFIIEHSHRLAGYIVGCCAIVLAAGLAFRARNPLRWLGILALLAVIIQGLLGGFRVILHAILGTNLAMIHGTFAQIVFSLLVVIALLTSRTWFRIVPDAVDTGRSLRFASLLAVVLMFMQIVAGALLRHTYTSLSQRLHLLFAFAATAAVIWLVKMIFDRSDRALRTPAWILSALLFLQLMLGAEAWMRRFSGDALPEAQHVTAGQAAVVTAHVLIGFCLLATTVVITLCAFRQTHRTAASPRLSGDLEAAA